MTLNKDAAALLEGFADALEIKGANQFRVRAFRTGARRVDALTEDIADIVEADALQSVPGIGKGIAGLLTEFVTTGRVVEYDEMLAEIPAGVFEMLRIPGLGPKTAATLYNDLGITSVDELETAAKADQLAPVRSIGAKRQERLLRELQRFRERVARHPLGDVLPIAEALVEHLRAAPGVSEAMYAGSLRRSRETIGDLDVLAAAHDGGPVVEHFLGHELVAEVLGSGPTKTSVLTPSGLQVDLLVVPPESWGAALTYFTGSMEHNVELRARAQKRGLSLNERGFLDPATEVRRPAAREEDVYATVGLPWIPPELRENRGEIEAAASGALPDLIVLDDIRGELHGHSLWSDGSSSIQRMIEAAHTNGYGWFAITDHSGSLLVANGLSAERIREQMAEIADAQRAVEPVRVLHGSEVEILADGSLDYEDDLLEELDVVVASIHSNFGQSVDAMTQRMVRAIEHPHVDVIGHPTGRRLGIRDGYTFDVEEVLSAAAATGTAMEINASPTRLDLNDVLARRAAELGAPIAINSDAHDPAHIEFMRFGVATARRAWLTAGHVLNTLEVGELVEWIGRPKPRQWEPRTAGAATTTKRDARTGEQSRTG